MVSISKLYILYTACYVYAILNLFEITHRLIMQMCQINKTFILKRNYLTTLPNTKITFSHYNQLFKFPYSQLMSLRTFNIFFVLVFTTINSVAQISLDNTSFEGTPQDATLPQGWFACEKGTTPDILPGPWGVNLESSDGDTYLGLITREDGSHEAIGQRLPSPLVKNLCYDFKIDLARSKSYAGYNFPIKLRIYVGNKKGQKKQLIWSSPTIGHSDWETYDIRFTPKKDFNYIVIEAYFADGILFKYNGNVLIDAITPLIPCIRA